MSLEVTSSHPKAWDGNGIVQQRTTLSPTAITSARIFYSGLEHEYTDLIIPSLVWSESVKVALQLFESAEWKDKDIVRVDHIVDVTLPVRPQQIYKFFSHLADLCVSTDGAICAGRRGIRPASLVERRHCHPAWSHDPI